VIDRDYSGEEQVKIVARDGEAIDGTVEQ
jgi:hypothetical protein